MTASSGQWATKDTIFQSGGCSPATSVGFGLDCSFEAGVLMFPLTNMVVWVFGCRFFLHFSVCIIF
jgi:hypothetical protein